MYQPYYDYGVRLKCDKELLNIPRMKALKIPWMQQLLNPWNSELLICICCCIYGNFPISSRL